MQTLVYALDGLGMLAIGPAAAVVLRRRTGAGWGPFGLGAVTFVVSQLVHLPLNAAVAWAFSAGLLPRPPAAWDLLLVPLALGASAGICEETTRFVALRRSPAVLRPAEATMFGLGHGGIEAAVLGVFLLLTLVQLVALRDPSAAARAGVSLETVTAYFDASPGLVLLGLLERGFALAVHVACTLLVARAIRTRTAAPWVAAFLLHAGVDSAAVAALSVVGPFLTEGVIGAFALLSVVVSVRLWRSWPAPPADRPPPPPLPQAPSGPRPLSARDAAEASIV